MDEMAKTRRTPPCLLGLWVHPAPSGWATCPVPQGAQLLTRWAGVASFAQRPAGPSRAASIMHPSARPAPICSTSQLAGRYTPIENSDTHSQERSAGDVPVPPTGAKGGLGGGGGADMGRIPCCEKDNVKRGQWTPEEVDKLLSYIMQYGTRHWRLIPKNAGLQRCWRSCRLRWTNYLRLREFTDAEEQTISKLHSVLGNRWSLIAAQLPGRTGNDVENHWNTKLKKKLSGMGRSRGAAALPEQERRQQNSSRARPLISDRTDEVQEVAHPVRQPELMGRRRSARIAGQLPL